MHKRKRALQHWIEEALQLKAPHNGVKAFWWLQSFKIHTTNFSWSYLTANIYNAKTK